VDPGPHADVIERMTRDAEPQPDEGDAQRLDKWLWHARFARTRAAAARLVEAGHVRVNSTRATTCGRRVRVGDVLTIALDRDVRVVRLIACAPRREGAPQARLLYDDLGSQDLSKEPVDAGVALLAPSRQRG
jgi:ribosome-associated heat shock protein Hsp15